MTAQTTQPASLPWLEKLIAFPTISGTSNLELIELIEAEFARYGYRGVRTYNEDRTRANLLVTIPAANGTTRGGLIPATRTSYPSPVRRGTPTPSPCVWRVPAPTAAVSAI